MKDQDTWRYYFGCICSIRFHPRNFNIADHDAHAYEMHFAAVMADKMLEKEKTRWPDGQQQEKQPQK